MAAGYATVPSNDKGGLQNDKFRATVAVAGTLNGSSEGIVVLPAADNGWELTDVVLTAGVNTTHTTGTSLTATVEKNTDGGTAALSTNPALLNTAGTGRKTTATAGTGITPAVIKSDGSEDFASYDAVVVTLSEAGTGGTDPSDVALFLEFTRKQDYDPSA